MLSFQSFLFYAISVFLVFSSIMVITRKNPVASAIFLVLTLFLVAALYALLGADFAAAIQVLVYAGAIMVLFLFVIMLLNVDPDDREKYRVGALEYISLAATLVGFAAIAISGLLESQPQNASGPFTVQAINSLGGNTNVVGWTFLVLYLWPFEISSFLILIAIVASIIIAKKPKTQNSQISNAKEF